MTPEPGFCIAHGKGKFLFYWTLRASEGFQCCWADMYLSTYQPVLDHKAQPNDEEALTPS